MKKLILWGIVFLMFASFASALEIELTDFRYNWGVNESDEPYIEDVNGTNLETVTNPPASIADGINGRAINSTGGDDELIQNVSVNLSIADDDQTINIWFRFEQPPDDDEYYITFGDDYPTSWIALARSSNNLKWRVQYPGEETIFGNASNYDDNQWHMTTLTINASADEFSMFVDGQYVNGFDSGSGSVDLTGMYVFGAPGDPVKWNVSFDEIQVFGKLLSDSEIVELWNGGTGRFYVNYSIPPPPPPPSNTINLSSPLPASNSQFNVPTVNFNLTANASYEFNCSSYINDTWNQTINEFSAGINIAVDFNVTFSDNGEYNYIIGCWDGLNDTNTSSHIFYIDTVNPTIDEEDINNSHQELDLTYSINVSDIYLYSFMMNDSCGNDNKTVDLGTSFSFTDSYNIETCSVGLQETNITVCDGQTSPLNCVDYTYYWNKTAVVNITVYDTINGVFIDSFTINDSDKSISTTDGNVSFWKYAVGNYSLTLSAIGYATTSVTVGFDDPINTYQFNVYTTNSFNFTFRSEMNEEIISQNITVEFISDVASYNYTAVDGILYVDVITPATYTLRYYSNSPSDYGLIREYIYRLTNRTHQDLTLWMIDDSNSTEITITVYDETTLNLVENAIVYVQKYFIDDNIYRTVAIYSTDVAGKSYFDIEADNQYYKILIDYPWETRKYTSEKFYFSATAYNVYISFLEEIAEGFFDEEGISVNIIYSNPTSKFTATWVDSEAVATQYCLYLKKYGQYSKETLNSSCSSAHSGSIELSGFGNDTINYAIFTATINGDERVIASSWKELVSDKLNAGAFGVFMTAVLVGMFAFMVSFHIISLILGAAALIFAKMLGLITLGWPYIFGIFFAAVILALMLRLWTK